MFDKYGSVLGILALMIAGCGEPRQITSAEGDLALVVEGNNQFAMDLYEVTGEDEGNLFFSPFSITAALSMVYGGAEGDTRSQMADVLGVALDEDAWHDNLAALFDDLSGEHNRGYTLHTANGVWGQDGVPFVEDYTALLDDEDGLTALEQSPTAAQLEEWLGSMSEQTVQVTFPAFEMDVSIPLSETLVELGMTDAFDSTLADFTGMVAAQDMEYNYFVTSTRHQATVQVDERGTTATAATGVAIGVESADESHSFRADHPFVFLIRDMLTGTVLFMGRLEDPTA